MNPSDLATRVVQHGDGAVAVGMRPIPQAITVWADTPESAATASACAAVIVPVDDERSEIVGHADRYGGVGILNNGGAGRGGFVNGMYLKGIGRTPLIGLGQRHWHSDGHLFVEEAVRECILGSIAAVELPWGGVRPTAVVDLGEQPGLDYRDPASNVNRTAIVVREPTLRLAHFERALLYRSEAAFSGLIDEKRVEANIARGIAALGRDRFLAKYVESWYRWADQCAYQFIHRMPQTSPSTSNIALDGRLIDFGGSRSLPCWGVHVPGAGLSAFGTEIGDVIRFLHSGGQDVLRRAAPDEDASALTAFVEKACMRRYAAMLVKEVLRLVGFRRAVIEDWLSSARRFREVELALGALIRKARTYRAYEPEWSEEAWRWMLPSFWSPDPPRSLKPLRALCDTIGYRGEPVEERARLRTRSRPELDYGWLNRDIFRAFDCAASAETYSTCFREYVARRVTRNRRDARIEPVLARPAGFVATCYQTFALFQHPDGKIAAYAEFDDRGRVLPAPTPVAVEHVCDSEIRFADGRCHRPEAAELFL